MKPLKVMGLQEVTEAVGVRPNTISAWIKRGHIPPPDARLACGPIWRQSTIAAWASGPGRERIARSREWVQ